MFIATHHRTLVAFDVQTHELRQVKAFPEPGRNLDLIDIPDHTVAQLKEMQASPGSPPTRIAGGGPLDGCELARTGDPEQFTLRRGGLFGGAEQATDAIRFDRHVARAWELFQFVSHDEARDLLRPIQDQHALAETVRELISDGRPVCLHFGCGLRLIEGFLNIDLSDYRTYADNYFNFDFTGQAWPLPDACVDYVYSEDFIEHIPQKNQIAFLAEAFRVLKPGGYNRVNTPSLSESMARSDFARGFAGVYFEEYDQWQHVALFTPRSLDELARIIGYRHVLFTGKSRGTSRYAVPDTRPWDDRDELVGNIYADLLK